MRPACLPQGPLKSLGIAGSELAVCVEATCASPAGCLAYDIPTRTWSHLDVSLTPEGASPQGASCGQALGPVLPPRFQRPEQQILWSATLSGRKLQACPAPGAADCIALDLDERWAAPPQVIVSADRTGAVVWGKPAGGRHVAAIYDARSGKLERALATFPGNRSISRWDVMHLGYWGNVLWATWPACEACPTRETWTFDAKGHNPRLLGHHHPAYAPYDDRLELVDPQEDSKVILLDRTTGALAGTYPLGYRNRWGATLLAAGKGQFVLALHGKGSRTDAQGDDDHPDAADLLILDVDAARAGRPLVRRGVRYPRCTDETEK